MKKNTLFSQGDPQSRNPFKSNGFPDRDYPKNSKKVSLLASVPADCCEKDDALCRLSTESQFNDGTHLIGPFSDTKLCTANQKQTATDPDQFQPGQCKNQANSRLSHNAPLMIPFPPIVLHNLSVESKQTNDFRIPKMKGLDCSLKSLLRTEEQCPDDPSKNALARRSTLNTTLSSSGMIRSDRKAKFEKTGADNTSWLPGDCLNLTKRELLEPPDPFCKPGKAIKLSQNAAVGSLQQQECRQTVPTPPTPADLQTAPKDPQKGDHCPPVESVFQPVAPVANNQANESLFSTPKQSKTNRLSIGNMSIHQIMQEKFTNEDNLQTWRHKKVVEDLFHQRIENNNIGEILADHSKGKKRRLAIATNSIKQFYHTNNCDLRVINTGVESPFDLSCGKECYPFNKSLMQVSRLRSFSCTLTNPMTEGDGKQLSQHQKGQPIATPDNNARVDKRNYAFSDLKLTGAKSPDLAILPKSGFLEGPSALGDPFQAIPVPSPILLNERTAKYSFEVDDGVHRSLQRMARIGEGDYGKIYRVFNLCDQRHYVVKRFTNMLNEGRRESRMMAIIRERTDCKHLVRYFYSWEEPGCVHLMMEDCVESVDKFFGRDPSQANENTLLILAEHVSKALKALHASHIAHLDLKPSNVLLSATGVFKVCDFGQSRCLDFEDDVVNIQEGTFRYIPAEFRNLQNAKMVKEGLVDPTKVDVYSMGVMLLELVMLSEMRTDHSGFHDTIVRGDLTVIDRLSSCSLFFKNLLKKMLCFKHQERWPAKKILTVLKEQNLKGANFPDLKRN